MNLPRHSAKIIKRIGEIGSPYLRHLETLKKGEEEPLTKIEKDAKEISMKIISLNLLLNPNDSKHIRRKDQSTLSYAFERSSLSRNPFFLDSTREWMFS